MRGKLQPPTLKISPPRASYPFPKILIFPTSPLFGNFPKSHPTPKCVFAKYTVNLSLRMKLKISFSISVIFLFGVGVNFKPLVKLKTPTCLSVRHVLDKFMTLGWIIVCLFDWCELHPVSEAKNYLCLRHLIVDLYLSLVYQVLLQFDFVFFVRFFFPDWFNYNHVKLLNFPNLCLFFWCRVFSVLIIFCILFCSTLVICSFLSRASTSASIFTIFVSISPLTNLCYVVIVLFTFLFRFSFLRVPTEFSVSIIKISIPFRVKNNDWFLLLF